MFTNYPALFAPFTLAGKRLKNRIVHASMTTRMGAQSDLQQNPLGYEVISYRRDAEVGIASQPAPDSVDTDKASAAKGVTH